MAINAGRFSSTRQPNKTSKRRVFAENLLFSSLKGRGSEMLDVLFRYAKEAEKEELRVRAAKEALTLMLPASNMEVELTENSNTEIFAGLTLEEAYKVRELMQPAITELTNELIAKVKQG